MSPEFKKLIKSFFKGDIADDETTLAEHAKDASLFRVEPKLVAFPKDAEDVKRLVSFVVSNKASNPGLSITARSAGSCMSGGSLNDSIILDTTRYVTGIVSWDEKENQVTVKPGTFYRDLEKETLTRGLFFPSYPASKNLCAIGGMVNNNAGGEKTLLYGKTENFVVATKTVFTDGNEYVVKPLSKAELDMKIAQNDFEGSVYRGVWDIVSKNKELLARAKPKVSKNSAGYYLWNVWNGTTFDLNKLLVGSQGTLGITTEVTLQLVPVQKYSRLFVIFLRDLKPISELVNRILPLKPESIETYDDHTMRLAFQFLPDLMRTMKTGLFKLMLSFVPELFMMLRTRGLPKMVLLVEFVGNDEKEIERRLTEVSARIYDMGLVSRATKSVAEGEKYWTIRRESFNLLRKHVKGKRTAPFVDDVIVRPEFLPEFLPKMTAILDTYKMLYTIAGHAGDGNFHIIPLMDMHDAKNREVIMKASKEVYDLVLSYGGSITAEHNDGIIRTPFLEQMYGKEVVALFQKTKIIFDPQSIFNPGKKVGGTFEAIEKKLVRE